MATLSSILNVPKLEQVFSQLVTRLAQQEAEIGRLRERLESAALERRLLAVEARVATQEAQCAVPESTLTIGRCVFETRAALARLADAVEAKADGDVTRRALDEAAEATDAKLQSLAERTADLAYARSLEDVTDGIEKRLSAAETSLKTKLDLSEAAKVRATCDRLKTADAKLEHCLDALGKHDDELEDARLRSERLGVEVAAAADVAAAERLALDTKATAQSAAIACFERRAGVFEARLDGVEVDLSKLAKTAEGRFRAAERQQNDLDARMQRLALAARADVAKLARTREHDAKLLGETLDHLKTDLDGRTAVKIDVAIARIHDHALAQLKKRTTSLEDQAAATAKHLDVALRFVDWFAQRGAAYEHNVTALDRRLDGMVLGGDHNEARHNREPFAANVRLSP